MEDFIRSTINFLLVTFDSYQVIIMGILMTIILLVLNLVKKPIKLLTNKIKNEKLRKLANKSIIVLSFAFAIGLWFILHSIKPAYFDIDWTEIVFTGALPIVAYAIGDGVFVPSKAEAIVKAAQDITEDGKVTVQEGIKLINVVDDAVNGETDKAVDAAVENAAQTLDDLLNL